MKKQFLINNRGLLQGTNQHLYQDVFDPAFKDRLKGQIQEICLKTAGDTNCIGYWWTDVPRWRLNGQKQEFGQTYVEFIRGLPESAPGRIRYEQYKQHQGGGDAGFLVLIARELYTATAEFYRKFAPGRLLFGERFLPSESFCPYEIITECGKVVDVLSIQPFRDTISAGIVDKIHGMTGKPIMLSDWNVSFPVGSYTNTMWQQFPNESEAAKGYEAYLVSAFAKPYILEEPSASANSNYRSSELGKAFSDAEAGRILAGGLKHFDLDDASLEKTAKGDWRKVAIARTISERTTVRQDWIAERLHLKSASNVSQRVRQYRVRDEKDKSKQERSWEKRWRNSKFLD